MSSTSPYIVVGIDGSDGSLEALRWAIHHAELVGADVHAVIAWEYPAMYGGHPQAIHTKQPQVPAVAAGRRGRVLTDGIDWRRNAQQTIDTAMEGTPGAAAGKVSATVTEGHPVWVLLEAARGAELLVVGNRGHGGFAGMLLGSVSERVIAHATCPVLVVPHPAA